MVTLKYLWFSHIASPILANASNSIFDQRRDDHSSDLSRKVVPASICGHSDGGSNVALSSGATFGARLKAIAECNEADKERT